MANTSFMLKKYSLDTLVSAYLQEIKGLRPSVQSPADEGKLQTYYQAVNTFKRVSIKDVVQFALSFGRNASGRSAQMRAAFPVILGNRVSAPSTIDLAYARLLLAYAKAFQENKSNLKDWMLKFILTSRFSPLHGYIEQEISQVINNTSDKIVRYEAIL